MFNKNCLTHYQTHIISCINLEHGEPDLTNWFMLKYLDLGQAWHRTGHPKISNLKLV